MLGSCGVHPTEHGMRCDRSEKIESKADLDLVKLVSTDDKFHSGVSLPEGCNPLRYLRIAPVNIISKDQANKQNGTRTSSRSSSPRQFP